MTDNKQLAAFIFRFEFLVIAVQIAIVVNIYEIFIHYDAQTFTVLTLASLIINAVILKRFGYIIDGYSKKLILQIMSCIVAVVIALVAIFDYPWLYLVLFIWCTLFFNVFYSIYNASSQTLRLDNKRHISAAMEVVGKTTYLTSAMLIWYFFDQLGSQIIFMYCVIHLFISTLLLNQFSEVQHTNEINESDGYINNKNLGFNWMLAQPIIWLISLTIVCNLMVLQSNTINSLYIYQVLKETPETLSLVSAAFSIGSLISSIASFWVTNEKKVIYASYIVSSIMSVCIAMNPTVSMFIVAMAVFGMSNSITRVVSRSLIMQCIPNSQSGTFYTLIGSMVSCIQFFALGAMTIIVSYISTDVVVWFFPAMVMIAPLLWVVKHSAIK